MMDLDGGMQAGEPMGQGAANASGVLGQPILPEELGHVTLEPVGDFEAGSFQSFTLVYTAGKYGIDDSGSLRVCWRFASDQMHPQFDDPARPNFTTITASNSAVLQYRYDPKGNVPLGPLSCDQGRAWFPEGRRHDYHPFRGTRPGLARHARSDLLRGQL